MNKFMDVHNVNRSFDEPTTSFPNLSDQFKLKHPNALVDELDVDDVDTKFCLIDEN